MPPPGLQNLGNTCFMNSCIQLLYQIHEMSDLLQTWNKESDTPDAYLVHGWKELRQIMFENSKDERRMVAPHKFLRLMSLTAQAKNRELFSMGNQNDITEFMLFITESVHKVLARPIDARIRGTPVNEMDEMAIQCYKAYLDAHAKDYSEIIHMFNGIYMSEIWSRDGSVKHTSKSEVYSQLDLPIPAGATTLYHCLDEFVRDEYLEGENAWFNEKTGQKENICKRIRLWSSPAILVITLQRFNGDSKKMDMVDFPVEEGGLDLSKYIVGYNPDKYKYSLVGVCSHVGNMHGGHYVAFTRDTYDKQWYFCNDEQIECISGDDVQRAVVNPHAYCLVYRRMPERVG
jgi:ubiquitin C-terminal hydrolase